MNSVKSMTLEDRCLVSVALSIWKCCPKTKKEIIDFQKSTCWSPFQHMCDTNIDSLELAEQAKRNLKLLIKYIGIEVSSLFGYWKMISSDEDMIRHFISRAHWTEQGLVDISKTARELLKMDSISRQDKYKLACTMCFQVQVAKLWKELTESERSSFLQIPDASTTYLDLVTVWSLLRAKKHHKILEIMTRRFRYLYEDISEYLFLCAVSSGCLEAVDYFWHEISFRVDKPEALEKAIDINDDRCDDIEDMAANVCKRVYFSPLVHRKRIMVYLFTAFDEEPLAHLLTFDRSYFEHIIKSFLEWPAREHFMVVLDKMQPLFSADDYIELFMWISINISRFDKWQDCYYRNILKQVWKKLRALDQGKMFESMADIVGLFIIAEDTSSCRMILNDMSPKQKEDMIFSSKGIGVFNRALRDNYCEMLSIVLEECLSIDKLKQFQSLFGRGTKMHKFLSKVIESKKTKK